MPGRAEGDGFFCNAGEENQKTRLMEGSRGGCARSKVAVLMCPHTDVSVLNGSEDRRRRERPDEFCAPWIG